MTRGNKETGQAQLPMDLGSAEGRQLTPAPLRRAAFGPVMFPAYFGMDEEDFNERAEQVPEEAFRQSHPAVLRGEIYRNSSQSMRQHRKAGIWVLLSAGEYNSIINVPEAYANGSDIRNRSLFPASGREQDERTKVAARAGAHALEPSIEKMTRLISGYSSQIAMLRDLISMVPYHWHANRNGLQVHYAAMTAYDGLHSVLQDIADVRQWTSDDLEMSKLGLEKRLLAGRGQRRLEEKKAAWIGLSRVLGNHKIAKRVLAGDRLDRSVREVESRLAVSVEEVRE